MTLRNMLCEHQKRACEIAAREFPWVGRDLWVPLSRHYTAVFRRTGLESWCFNHVIIPETYLMTSEEIDVWNMRNQLREYRLMAATYGEWADEIEKRLSCYGEEERVC